MDEFNLRMEELNSKFSSQNPSMSQKNLNHPGEVCNGSAPASLFMSSLGNGTLKTDSSFSTQLSKDSPLLEEIMVITRGQRQMMHQLENLTNFVHENLPRQEPQEKK